VVDPRELDGQIQGDLRRFAVSPSPLAFYSWWCSARSVPFFPRILIHLVGLNRRIGQGRPIEVHEAQLLEAMAKHESLRTAASQLAGQLSSGDDLWAIPRRIRTSSIVRRLVPWKTVLVKAVEIRRQAVQR